MDRIALAHELTRLAKMIVGATPADFDGMEPTIQVKSAVFVGRHVPARGVDVGLTKNDKVILFLSKDYDNRGNVYGPYQDISGIAGKDGFYMLTYAYDAGTMEKLGYDERDRQKLFAAAKAFASKNASSRRASTNRRTTYSRRRSAKTLLLQQVMGNRRAGKLMGAVDEQTGKLVYQIVAALNKRLTLDDNETDVAKVVERMITARQIAAALPRGKAQVALYNYMSALDNPEATLQLADVARHPSFRRIHFGEIQSAAAALAKKGILDFDGSSKIRLKRED